MAPLFFRWVCIIVGVDSGAWSAVAVLDFSGRLVALESHKNWLPGKFSAFIAEYSPITIIASDRNPPSSLARKLAASFSARLFKPSHSLTLLEKYRYVRDMKVNAHERDAYSAAKKAYDVLCSNKMRQVTRKFGERATPKFKAAVLSGTPCNKALEQA